MHQHKTTFSATGIVDTENIKKTDITYSELVKYLNESNGINNLIKLISKGSHKLSSIIHDGENISIQLKPIKESFRYTVYYKCGNGRYKVEFYKKYKINGRHCHIGWSDTESGAIQMCKKYNDLYSEIIKNPSK
jgi:hypothetical protein